MLPPFDHTRNMTLSPFETEARASFTADAFGVDFRFTLSITSPG